MPGSPVRQAGPVDRVELTDGTVHLRRPRADDAPEVIAAVQGSQPDIGRWLTWAGPGYGQPEFDAYLASARKGDEPFLVFHTGSRLLVGGCGLNQLDGPNLRANLGYWVRTAATGRGVATRAARLVAWYGHTHLHLHRLEVVVAVGNRASEAVAAKLGAVREGVLRGRFLLGERGHGDATMFSLLPEDTVGWARRYGLRARRGPEGPE